MSGEDGTNLEDEVGGDCGEPSCDEVLDGLNLVIVGCETDRGAEAENECENREISHVEREMAKRKKRRGGDDDD